MKRRSLATNQAHRKSKIFECGYLGWCKFICERLVRCQHVLFLKLGEKRQKVAYFLAAFHAKKTKKAKMVDQKLSIPSSGGGLVRYFEEYKSKFQIKPEIVVLIIILIIAFEVLVRLI